MILKKNFHLISCLCRMCSLSLPDSCCRCEIGDLVFLTACTMVWRSLCRPWTHGGSWNTAHPQQRRWSRIPGWGWERRCGENHLCLRPRPFYTIYAPVFLFGRDRLKVQWDGHRWVPIQCVMLASASLPGRIDELQLGCLSHGPARIRKPSLLQHLFSVSFLCVSVVPLYFF